jgi:hypothetical protein
MSEHIIYDDATQFTRLQPVGTISYSIVDPFAANLKLLTQSYVMRADGYNPPAYGTTHQTQKDATLIDVSPTQDIGGGLIKVACTFVIGAPQTFERDTSRTYEFPGIKIPEVTINEQYEDVYELPRSQWKASVVTVPGIPGQPNTTGYQINYIKEASRVGKRQFVVPNVVLREPKSLTVNVTEKITYCTTALPTGASITGSAVSPFSIVRNRKINIGGTKEDQLGIPTTNEAFEIFGNANLTAKQKVEQAIKDQLHPRSQQTTYNVPSLESSAERTNYLSDDTTPSIDGYFAQDKIYLEATSIQQVRGCLYKYTDIITDPK